MFEEPFDNSTLMSIISSPLSPPQIIQWIWPLIVFGMYPTMSDAEVEITTKDGHTFCLTHNRENLIMFALNEHAHALHMILHTGWWQVCLSRQLEDIEKVQRAVYSLIGYDIYLHCKGFHNLAVSSQHLHKTMFGHFWVVSNCQT